MGSRRAPSDAHDAGVFGVRGLDVFQLMLMMLGCLGGQGPGVLQLMVMMVGVWGLWLRRSPADAHGAGCLGGRGLDVFQLKLMMLGCLVVVA